MAKSNKKQEKAIIENLPVASTKWIKQPWNLTFVKGEMSLMQLDVFVTLVDRLQEKINNVLSGKSGSLFEDSEYDTDDVVQVRVPLSSVTSQSEHYSEVASAAYRLYNLSDVVEYVDDEGIRHVELTHLFQAIDIPETEAKRRQGDIMFCIHRKMIDKVFALNHYTRYIKDIARSFHNAYTGRLYMYIVAYKGIGEWTVGYDDLREMLGCRVWERVEEKKKEEWVEKKYPKYRNFRDRVLEDAKKELRALAETNSIDCYFDYEAIKAEGRGVLEGPRAIRFKIYVTSYGKEESEQLAENNNIYKFENILRNVHGLKTSQVKSILNLLKKDNAAFLLKKLEEITPVIQANKEGIRDVRRYILSSLKNALSETNVQEEASVVVQNGCTEAVEWLWKAKSRHDVDSMNTMIGSLNYAIDSQLPDYNKKNLINHMKMYYSVVDEFPTPPRIIAFLKKQMEAASGGKRRGAAYIPPTAISDKERDESGKRKAVFTRYRKFVKLVSKLDESLSSVYLAEECTVPLSDDKDADGMRVVRLSVPSSFVIDRLIEAADVIAEPLASVYGANARIEYKLRGSSEW